MKKYYKHCLFIANKVLNFINLNSFWGFESSFEMKELRGYGILAFTILETVSPARTIDSPNS